MLQNEQTKLELLQASAAAEQAADLERRRELALSGQGSVGARFRPGPP
jgi:hypothetical protein